MPYEGAAPTAVDEDTVDTTDMAENGEKGGGWGGPFACVRALLICAVGACQALMVRSCLRWPGPPATSL